MQQLFQLNSGPYKHYHFLFYQLLHLVPDTLKLVAVA